MGKKHFCHCVCSGEREPQAAFTKIEKQFFRLAPTPPVSLIITLLSSLERENIVQSNDAASHPHGLYSAVRINKAVETRTIRFLNLFPTQVRAIEVSIGSKTKEAKLIHYLERRGILGSYASFAGRIPAQARTTRNLKQKKKNLQREDFRCTDVILAVK